MIVVELERLPHSKLDGANIPLQEGPNSITITATDPSGNATTAVVTANYEPRTRFRLRSLFRSNVNASYSTQDSLLDIPARLRMTVMWRQ